MTIKANNAWNKKPVYFNAAGWSGDLGMGSHGLENDVMGGCRDDVMKPCSGVSHLPPSIPGRLLYPPSGSPHGEQIPKPQEQSIIPGGGGW